MLELFFAKRVIADWRRVLRHAWSVRLLFLAAVLSGGEIILPYYSDYFSRGTFAVLSFLVTAMALVSRFVAQERLHQDGSQ